MNDQTTNHVRACTNDEFFLKFMNAKLVNSYEYLFNDSKYYDEYSLKVSEK